MKRLLRALEVLAWFALFALAALVLALRYWVLPNIERYRPDIVAAISKAVGLPVKVGAIEASWSGLRPDITVSDVRIHDGQGREALVLPSVHNVIAWGSLLHWDLRLHSLVVDGARLAVRRDPAGAIYVAGIRLSGQGGEGSFRDWVLGQEEIVIRKAEIEWRDEKRGAPPLKLSAVELRVRNSGDEHAFGLSGRLPAGLGSTIDLRAHLEGRSVMEPAAWNGRLYAEIGTTDLAAWRAWLDYPLDLRQGHGALRLWITLAAGNVSQATADVALSGVVAQLGDAPAQLELATVRGRLQGRVRGDGYELSGRNLGLVPTRGASIAPTDFQLAWRAGGGSLATKLLDLSTLPELMPSFPVVEGLRQRLAEASPRGRLEDARFEWQGELPEPRHFVARARFSNLALRPTASVPGFAGLSGSIDATDSRGRVVLQSKHAQLELPVLFPEPRIPLDALSGQVDWERAGSALALRLVSLGFANADLAGTASGSYSRAGDQGWIDLTAQLSRVDGTKTARYLPHGSLMGEKTREWLASAIVAGQASDVQLRLRGDLREFPFRDPGSGQFLVTARVADGVLDYGPGWPRIEGIDASLRFEADRMAIAGRSASILGVKLSNVRVAIPQMVRQGTHLTVSGNADGPTGEFLRFVASSPVARKTGDFTAGVRAAGQARLKLSLDLPLSEIEAAKVAGEFQFSANDITVHEEIPRLERADGNLTFTESGFMLHDVRAHTLGSPVAIRGGTRADGSIEVVARGAASVEAVRELFDHPLARYASGEAAYVVTFGVRDGVTGVRIDSPLRGVAIALPPPFRKDATEPLPLHVELAPSKSGVRERISVTLGSLAAAQMQLRREGEGAASRPVVRRASMWLTPVPGEAIRLPERPGTLVYGSLAAFDADKWIDILKTETSSSDAQPVSIDMKFGVLDAYGKRVHNLQLRAGGERKGWSAAIKADELSGDVTFSSDKGGALFARLARFRLPEDSPQTTTQAPRQPADVPAVDAVIERFSYRGKDLGHVEFLAQREADAWRFDKLRVVNPEGILNAKGLWQSGTPSQSTLQFDLESADTGALLARVGYPEHVKGGQAKLSGSLAWQGPLLALDIPTLSGDVELHAQEGQFLEVEPGIGKLISLMSLQALPRRIVLDFRDVFSKGFQFDRITARAQLDKGVMAIQEFRMRGSAGEVQMSGSADLVRETQDLKVRVVPSLGDTASTAVAIANPLAGAAALLAQRLLKDPLGRIFAFDYGVTGNWSDPKVEKLNQPQPLVLP
ncbi:MAG TPA: YhdP family protein [Burkholderiales bacterium]